LIRLAQGHQDWTLGFLDEVWWSRFANPNMHAWGWEQPLRLLEQKPSKDDDEPKALACYGVYFPQAGSSETMLLRFVKGRPVSSVTTTFLEWICRRLKAQGKRVWALVWDRASWHTSRETQHWIEAHNQKVKRTGEGVRILSCLLPSKSPWLNPIEPKWLHGKRAVVKAEGVLTVKEVIDRVHAYYGCEPLPHIVQSIN
jgi:hypothetical protein